MVNNPLVLTPITTLPHLPICKKNRRMAIQDNRHWKKYPGRIQCLAWRYIRPNGYLNSCIWPDIRYPVGCQIQYLPYRTSKPYISPDIRYSNVCQIWDCQCRKSGLPDTYKHDIQPDIRSDVKFKIWLVIPYTIHKV